MRHRVHGYKLNRDTAHRTALFRNLVAGLFEHGQITTTKQKAKAVQPMAEKLITLAKRGNLHARRRAISILRDRIMCDDDDKITRNRNGDVVKGPKLIRHLFEEIGPKYADRNGGYTRIVKLGTHRLGDGGDLVMLQLVGDEGGPEIGGLSSNRRDKAARRREFAEKLGGGAATATAVVEEATKSEAAFVEEETAATATEESEPESAPEGDASSNREDEEKT